MIYVSKRRVYIPIGKKNYYKNAKKNHKKWEVYIFNLRNFMGGKFMKSYDFTLKCDFNCFYDLMQNNVIYLII